MLYVQVARSSTHVRKGAKFGVQKVNNGLDIHVWAEPPVLGMGSIVKNMLRVNKLINKIFRGEVVKKG